VQRKHIVSSINAGRKSIGTSHYLGQNFAKALMLSLLMQKESKNMFGNLLGCFNKINGCFSNDAF
jgi:hypothetical protein